MRTEALRDWTEISVTTILNIRSNLNTDTTNRIINFLKCSNQPIRIYTQIEIMTEKCPVPFHYDGFAGFPDELPINPWKNLIEIKASRKVKVNFCSS